MSVRIWPSRCVQVAQARIGPSRVMGTIGGTFIPATQISEMVGQHWKKVGIQADIVELERSLATKRVAANDLQISVFGNDGGAFTTTPVQGTNWALGPNFGTALNRFAYTTPRELRVSFGVRF